MTDPITLLAPQYSPETFTNRGPNRSTESQGNSPNKKNNSLHRATPSKLTKEELHTLLQAASPRIEIFYRVIYRVISHFSTLVQDFLYQLASSGKYKIIDNAAPHIKSLVETFMHFVNYRELPKTTTTA